ncbi:MAG: transglycosylase SLT domain-containing protein [Pseudomonadota bacterium]
MVRLIFSLSLFGLVGCQFSGDQRHHEDYAYWSAANQDGSWTSVAEKAVRATSLPQSEPGDILSYCIEYPGLGTDDRVRFWVGLLSAMAEHESDLDPQTKFAESLRDSRGQPVVSRGLLQLSIESANQARYSCQIDNANELHDPSTNIECAAKILSTWVSSDGVIAASSDGYRGGARYWSVLRSNRDSSTDIQSATRKLRFCAG